jgi:osmotically inducible protein OsmC
MARRTAHAEWIGEIETGAGEVAIGGERLGLAYTPAWSQEGAGTNPEDLLAAAHAASFAVALEGAFVGAHRRALGVRVRAELYLDRRDGQWTITRSDLEAEIGLEEQPRERDLFESEFQRIVEHAAATCPVSRALAGVEITVDARPAGAKHTARPPATRPRGVRPDRIRDERLRRAFEGQVVSRMRARAHERERQEPRPPEPAVAPRSQLSA